MVGPASPPEQPQVPVPHTNRNPIQSLRPAPIAILVGGKEYEIPALPAADWLEIFTRSDWIADDILMDLANVPPGDILEMDPLDIDDLAIEILEEVSARHWWVANRLIRVVMSTWDVMGPETMFHGVDAGKVSLAAWLDAVLVLLMRRINDDQASMFVMQLEAPPMGEELPSEEMEMSEGEFLSLGD